MNIHEDIAARPQAFNFFAALRRLECEYANLPRLGRSTRVSDDFIRLRQRPSLGFAPAMNESYIPPGERSYAILTGYFFGLFGPNGPLPLHLTEYAQDRLQNGKDRTFSRFADIFHHRLLSLFYRAWADVRPTVQFDRPQDDRFSVYVKSLVGHASPGLQNRDALPDRARMFYAGRLSPTIKNAEGLAALIAGYFAVKVEIESFVGEWMRLPVASHTTLGGGEYSQLGRTAVAGERVFGAQHKFALRLGPLSFADFRRFLPGRGALKQLAAAVRSYAGREMNWDCRLVLRRGEAPPLRLGEYSELGWTSWLSPSASGPDLADVAIAANHC